MKTEVKIPSIGESISSGLLSVWYHANGASVEENEPLFTLETDKISTEIPSPASGVLMIFSPSGEEVRVGQTVAAISSGDPLPPAPEKPAPIPTPATPPPPPSPRPFSPPPATPPPPRLIAEPFEPTLKIAAPQDSRTSRKKLSPLRRKIASQLVTAQQNAAILSTFNECDMTAVLALRDSLREEFHKRHGTKLGFMSFFVKAAVDALKRVPAMNARMDGEDLLVHHYYDISVAVGTDRGLLVPVLRDCDKKSFAEIERDLAAYARKGREGKIALDDLRGGVFSISNGGIYGSLLSTPLLNPPQSGILGMHKIQDRPVAINGQVVIRPMMYLALSYDHRIVDGKEAVSFLGRIKDCIENPARLLLET